jgi:large subunit ribosomal protein L15
MLQSVAQLLRTRLIVGVSSSRYNNNNNGSYNNTNTHNGTPVIPLKLSMLRIIPGARHNKRRVGRGIGCSKGKTCGRGHKGQNARAGGGVRPSFEGGQTPQYKLFPKRGQTNVHAAPMLPLNLGRLHDYIVMGRVDATQPITLKTLVDAGMFKTNAIQHGVKLLAHGSERWKPKCPVTLQVSRASASAIAAVEARGGSVTTVHYNALALRALLRPHRFANGDDTGKHPHETRPPLPQPARPPPKWQSYYTRHGTRGYLHPAQQLRSWILQQERPDLQKTHFADLFPSPSSSS